MTVTGSSLRCAGCGWAPPNDEPYPFRCANAGTDDADHVLSRSLDLRASSWPAGGEANPFVRYRTLLHSHHRALAHGLSDGEFVRLIERLDAAVADVDGRGFEVTPFARQDELSERLGFEPDGGVWVKDETGGVAGSHKGRHLFGLLLHVEVAEATGLAPRDAERTLAIASCGNAAVAAAVLARAAGRPLRVFVPTWAHPDVLERLSALGARIEVCPREAGFGGDPTYRALEAAVAGGALPFTCQGSENGLAIEGGHTLAYEIVAAVGRRLDRAFVQVGGGALASAVAAGFAEAVALGAVATAPRWHAVQVAGGHPLARAFDLLAARVASGVAPADALAEAARHRSRFMWPWEEEPASAADGILDDETYDWLAVVRAMFDTGGFPVVVTEDQVARANELGRTTTGIDVDATGTAGLAGLLELLDRGAVAPRENVAVLFTGRRGAAAVDTPAPLTQHS